MEALVTRPGMTTSAVPSGRWERLARLGGLAGSVAGGMRAEGARQFARGQRPRLGGVYPHF